MSPIKKARKSFEFVAAAIQWKKPTFQSDPIALAVCVHGNQFKTNRVCASGGPCPKGKRASREICMNWAGLSKQCAKKGAELKGQLSLKTSSVDKVEICGDRCWNQLVNQNRYLMPSSFHTDH